MSFVPCCEDFIYANTGPSRSQRLDLIHRSLYLLNPLIKLGHKAGNGTSVTRNDDSFTPFDVSQKLRQMGLGV
jgi:hypothetical protein